MQQSSELPLHVGFPTCFPVLEPEQPKGHWERGGAKIDVKFCTPLQKLGEGKSVILSTYLVIFDWASFGSVKSG